MAVGRSHLNLSDDPRLLFDKTSRSRWGKAPNSLGKVAIAQFDKFK